jgi:purine-nucleoside phosphorylase
MEELTFPIYILKYFGVEKVIVTNSAGGINPNFSVGDYMLINDHINQFGTSPLIGKNNSEIGPRFLDMTEPYDSKLISIAKEKSADFDLNWHEGVYIGVSGPCYETKAEIRYFGKIGADAVGMSTVPEVIVANYLGMKVLGISFISNMGTGISSTKHDHKNVLEAAQKKIEVFAKWIREIVLCID